MEKKYRTEKDPETGGLLLRIIALKDFADVKKGDRGGLIKKENNLSQIGDCWVYDDAMITGDAYVYENAKISGKARIYGDARVHGKAEISGKAKVYGYAEVWENAKIYGSADVCENAEVSGSAQIYGNACVSENTEVSGNAKIYGDAYIYGNPKIYENAQVFGFTWIFNSAIVSGNVKLWSTNVSRITTPIKNNKGYTVLALERNFYVVPLFSDIKSLIDKDIISIDGKNYVENIQTIRQLYGKEI